MDNLLGFLSAGFISSVVIMNLLLPLAWRVGLVDNPGGRKQHASPTPLIGGLAIYLTLICVTLPMGADLSAF